MAYTNAIFYMDMESGSDAVRSTLSSCTASNPSGTITRINKTAHGLVTGAVVTLSNFTAWLNTVWKITVVDANNFDLDTAVWQATADATGDCVPFGGSSWADAWKFPVTGPTAARTQGGDIIRIAKSPDPVSLGQTALWTNGSQDVVLTSAVTKNIEDAITGWTVTTNVTGSTNTSRKFGATSQQMAVGASFTTGKVAYKAIAGGGTQDFSSYQKITLWVFPSVAIASGDFSISLCSDATGDTPVDTLNIPACPVANAWYPIVIDKGSALGASIQSVALYGNVDIGAVNIRLNNIVACGDLTLQSLIGKSGDAIYPIQSINGTTVKIDSSNTAATGRGYYGTTETVTTYRQETIKVTPSSSGYVIPEGGTSTTGYIEYSGGWDTGSTTRTGKTWIDVLATASATVFTISSMNFLKFNHLGLVRGSVSMSLANSAILELDNIIMSGSGSALSAGQGYKLLVTNSKVVNNSGTSSFNVGARALFRNCSFLNITGAATTMAGGCEFVSCLFANNGTADITLSEGAKYGTDALILRKTQLLSSTEFSFTQNRDCYAWSFDHDNSVGSNKGFTEGGTIEWQTGTVHSSEPGAWKLVCTSTVRSSFFPLTLPLGPFGVNSSSLVTFKVWVKKDHATNVSAKIYINGDTLNGVSATTTTKADDTNWEELTITFTPTQKGAIMVFVDVWCTSTTSANVYVGTATLTQA